jgi:DNA-binding response OmpR family regulator
MRVFLVQGKASVGDEVASALRMAGYHVEELRRRERTRSLTQAEDCQAVVLNLDIPMFDGVDAGGAMLVWAVSGMLLNGLQCQDAATGQPVIQVCPLDGVLGDPGNASRSETSSSACLVAGRIRIDPRRLIAMSDDKPVDLTPLEFRLLLHLVHHKDRVVPRKELEDHVFASEEVLNHDAIDALITRVHHKVGKGSIVATPDGFTVDRRI